ncbi:MAG: galactose-1-phosphate uridylyltransferase [Terriglobia bacterium]
MPEIRQNIITRQWVIIATERARRPEQFAQKGEKKALPAYDPTCPFCPGNEAMAPPETLRLPGKDGWQVRVVPNKFAALAAAGALVRSHAGIKRTMTGVGIHEVIVETPVHNATTALLSDAEVVQILDSYQQRYAAIVTDPRVAQVTLFKNHGEAAGTSLEHPHSQLIGTPIIPMEVRDRMETALHFYDEEGECVFCRTLAEERDEGTRVVVEGEHFTAFVPFAALSPFHIWIFPKRHSASFAQMDEKEKLNLARVLRRVLRKLYDGLGNPDYNYTIRTAPHDAAGVNYYHWYLSIVPRLTRMAGFELGSGMFINTALPEESAKFLRKVKVD